MSKAVDKMAKVRAAKKSPTYKNVHKEVPRDDDHYLCLKNVKEWQKHNKGRVKELKYMIRKGGDKKEIKPLQRELQNRQTYLVNIGKYFDQGIWLDLFYGKDQEKLMKYRTIQRAYDSEGYIKQNTPVVG
jgi:hypothetical protein